MSDAAPLWLRFDAFELDESNARLTRDGRAVALTPKAFSVLCTLARQAGRLVTKDSLLDAAWGHRHVSESVLKSTISQLRSALDDDARQPRYIETASRHGYRFIAQPEAAAVPAPTPSPAPAAAPPVAAFVPAGTSAPAALIGRGDGLARLHAAWARAQLGQRQVCWLSGEAGVGKSTLLDHFAAQLGSGAGAVVAHGQCVQQFGSGEPYLPVLEALGALCRHDAALPALLRAVAPTWLLQLPWLCGEAERAALQRELAGVHPDRMLREFAELLDRYTEQRALLLVTEDLHWSDHATVRLIDHFARRRSPARVMWLGSFRSAELIAEEHPLKGLRHELRLHRLGEEIVLDPFSEHEVGEYLQRRHPRHAGSEDFVRSLHAHTEGLPLFIVNVIDEWVALAGQQPEAAAPRLAALVPESLAGVIERQIERLSAERQAVLEAASVIGVEFRSGVLAEVLEQEAPTVDEHCDELVRRQSWLRPPAAEDAHAGVAGARYTFAHALYRHVFYRRLGAAARARLHRRVATTLERHRALGLAVPAGELAAHFEQAHEPLAALRHYADAAASALGRFAPTEVVTLTERALDLLPSAADTQERMELELLLVARRGLAFSMLESFSSAEAKQSFERALALCDLLPQTPQRAWVMSGLGWVLYGRAEYAAALALAQRIEAMGNEHGDAALRICACNLYGLTLSQQGDWEGGRAWLEQGVALCEAIGEALPVARFVIDPRVTLHALLGLALLPLGHAAEAQACRDKALALAERSGQRTAVMMALWCAGLIAQRLEQPELVIQHARALESLWLDHGVAAAEGPARWMRGWAIAQLGDARAGHTLIEEGLRFHQRTGRMAGMTHALNCAASALILAGDYAAAQAVVDEALERAQQLDELASIPDLLIQRARAAHACGRTDEARSALRGALDAARERRSPLLQRLVESELARLDGPAAAA
ncbi:MAG: AAA family ATPase [Piscinibacter sp.]